MNAVWDDPLVSRGTIAQFISRGKLVDAGHKLLGWKVAFGSQAAWERHGLKGPLIGFLTDRAVVGSGMMVSLSGWKKPVLEPEIAVHLGADLPGAANRASASAAISGLRPAFELADLVCPADDVERLLAGNINQRNIMLGLNDNSRAGGILKGLFGRVLRNGIEVVNTSDVQALPGELIGIVCHVANVLAAFGETLRAGQVILTGSIVQPLSVEAGDEVEFRLEPIDSVSIRLANARARATTRFM